MKRVDAIAVLRAHEAELRGLGVEHLYLFGSTARDEAREDSDVDLFIDYLLGLAEFVRIDGCTGSGGAKIVPHHVVGHDLLRI